MHRSGTSIFSRSLAQMGLFTGAKLDSNDEAYFFLKINQWLLKEMGGSWDNPKPLDEIVENHKICELYTQILKKELSSVRRLEYLGFNRFIRNKKILDMSEPWGWKDPRNIFTLPLWMKIFPEAKILHITRNGRDVARSLVERRGKRIDSLVPDNLQISRTVKTRVRYRGFGDTISVSDHNKGIELWGEYEQQVLSFSSKHDRNFLKIKFEDFIANPIAILSNVRTFCGIEATDEDVVMASKLVDSNKSGKEKKIDDSGIALQSKQLLTELGY